MLAEGAQDLADHQRTMRSTIAWSYESLSDEEKRLFRWLGVFVGGAAGGALESVTGMADDTLLRRVTSADECEPAAVGRQSRGHGATQLVTLRGMRRNAFTPRASGMRRGDGMPTISGDW